MIEKLAEEWRTAGIQEGDTLLLHSNIKSTLRRCAKQGNKVSPEDILDSFLLAVGSTGTMLLPLFNFGFPAGATFDIRNTPSRMGILTEAARNHKLCIRTGHPIYSFAVIGAKAEEFRGVDNFSGYGKDSPFYMLREMNGKIASLDLPDQNSMTFYHHVEEMNEVDYRYHKTFTGNYIDAAGNASTRTYGLFVRKIEEKVQTHVDPAGELMWEQGLYKGFRPGEGCALRSIMATEMYDFVTDIIKSGKAKNLLYKIEGELDE